MLAVGPVTFAIALEISWVPLVAGLLVTSLMLGFMLVFRSWRRPRLRRLSQVSLEEDLPWEALLRLLEKRDRERAAAGLPPEKTTDEELAQLLATLPTVPEAAPVELPEDREFQLTGGAERRRGRRRWGNPTEAHLFSYLWAGHRHGMVVNRSTGGLGIFTDGEVPPGTALRVRAAEAPAYVPAVQAEVRHCLKVGKGFILGCMFNEDLPWNLRVWFG
jgi:hypothetical protein